MASITAVIWIALARKKTAYQAEGRCQLGFWPNSCIFYGVFLRSVEITAHQAVCDFPCIGIEQGSIRIVAWLPQ